MLIVLHTAWANAFLTLVRNLDLHKTSANNSTWSRYLKKKPLYLAIIQGPIVGLIVVRYSTRGRVEYLYFG